MSPIDHAAAQPPPERPTQSAAPPKSRWQRVGADVASGARVAAPVLRRWATRFGDWLARIGWGKFFLLAILLMIAGGMAGMVLYERGPAVVIERGDPQDRVNVTVSVTPEGITIGTPERPAPPAPPRPPGAPVEKKAPGGRVQVDDRGVRIVAEKNGRQFEILVDDKGVRIEEAASDPEKPARTPGARERTIVIRTDDSSDPERVAEAVEAARERIEGIVSDQVSRQVARRTRQYQEASTDWLMSLMFLIVLSLMIVKIVLGSKRKAESRAQQATATAAEEGLKRQLAEAQLKMMQAQVEPHFLFNTLASVDFLIETDPSRASRMQKNLIQYLRAALPQMREGSTTLGKEVALCRAYLEILKVRMEDRLQFAINIPQGLASAQFPPMLLQSLVENAIKHGLEPKAEGGSLSISADVADGRLRVMVADTGLGMTGGAQPGAGVGLSNVRERLAALYNGAARLILQANTPSGLIATIEVPYSYDTEPADASLRPAESA